MTHGVKHFIWTVAGAITGAALAILATTGLTSHMIAAAPKDPSAGSVAIMIIFLLPAGFLLGGLAGFLWSLLMVRKRSGNIPPPLP